MQHKSPAQPATTRKRQRGAAARGGDLAQHSSNTCLVQGAPTLQRRCRQRAQPQGRQHPPLSMPASTSVGAVRAAHASPASWLRMAIYHADTHACLHQKPKVTQHASWPARAAGQDGARLVCMGSSWMELVVGACADKQADCKTRDETACKTRGADEKTVLRVAEGA